MCSSAQLLNPTISKFCYSSYMVIITLYNSKILLSLHYFLTPQFQTFTNLLIGIFGVSNPTFFLLRFLINYVSIIVNIISNNTVLQCYLLWIFVSIRRLLQLIVYIGVSTAPSSHLKNITPSFANSPLKSANYPKPPFQAIHRPQKNFFFHAPLPPKKKQSNFSVKSYNKNFFSSLTPSHLLKVTKFLVEISQFKFLVMTEKNIFIYKFFCH